MQRLGIARRTRVENNGDDTFQTYQQPTERTILNGELFKEKERVFLKKNLRLHNVSFPIGHDRTVQIELKSFWQPEALKFDGKGVRGGKFVTLLSDDQPPIKDAFAWIKLVYPLYKKGFSVVLLDLPGMGGSGCNANICATYEDWQEEDFRIVENAMRGLKVTRTHLIAFGRSCRIILKFAKHTHINGYSTFLAKEHCWYQPDVDFFALFQNEVGDCPPGRVQEWQIEAKQHHEHLFREVLKPIRLMAFHASDTEYPAVKATQDFITRARSSEACISEFYCTEVTREDICFARAHATLDVSIMAIAKNLINTMADFLLTANHGDVVAPIFTPFRAVEEGLFKDCMKGCVNPVRGLHHWTCPNHPRNAGIRRTAVAQPVSKDSEVHHQVVSTEEKLALPTKGRPSSAPARQRLPGTIDDRAALACALARPGTPQRTWVLSSQKQMAMEISSKEATMNSCLYRVKELNPPVAAVMQHQARIQALPREMRAWVRAAEKVFDEREAAIAKAEREEEERLELLAFRPKTMEETNEFEEEEIAEPEVDSPASEVSSIASPVQPKFSTSLSMDDFLMDVDWCQGSQSSKLGSQSPKLRSNFSSKLSFVAKLDEEAILSECSSTPSSPKQLPADRQDEPASPASEANVTSATPAQRPRSAGKARRKRPGTAESCSTRPPSGTGSASTGPSRPSSATRLVQGLFSSKLSRLARPASAVSRSSSSTKLSLEPAQGATSPSGNPSGGALASWFNHRRQGLFPRAASNRLCT